MRVNFLLGPAGSGKTARCVAEVRAALVAEPQGPPLLFLAPKQATFQLERQLLADASLPGYTRLRILSFERLARHVLDTLTVPPQSLLGEEGRLMVLRALLAAAPEEMRVFRASARLAGFAAEVDGTLRELQRHQVSPDQLDELAAAASDNPVLAGKLADLARLFRGYLDWLATHSLQDADRLLDLAARALKLHASAPPMPAIAGLWLDGFAEMTPQEIGLLTALLPGCQRATLAFCLDHEPRHAPPWLSIWSPVASSFRRLRESIACTGAEVCVETLPRGESRSRFAGSPALRHLEGQWPAPTPLAPGVPPAGIRVVSCANPAHEAALAAETILHAVREEGFRFREIAVLVRSLDPLKEPLRRAFRRHRIPFFLDHRESVAHHPLADLTRNALRTVAQGWQHADFFSALKTGLVPAGEAEIDELENEALARGWSGADWLAPLPTAGNARAAELEEVRRRVVPPFLELGTALNAGGLGRPAAEMPPSGRELAAALRGFWGRLEVEATLGRWSERAAKADAPGSVAAQAHLAVWEQLQAWLDNVTLAFPDKRLPLREWLPILEAGLGHLTVGVIPPSLDQVLVGAVDRSRNPDLRLVILPGFNEGVFPAPPRSPQVLTDADRASLKARGLELGPDPRHQIGRERYLGYIACTRSREQLLVTFSRRDAGDKPANPSSFVPHIQRLFPQLEVEVLNPSAPAPTLDVAGAPAVALSPAIARRLYGPEQLVTSVSRLEDFAACPFKFLVAAGLRAGERQRFEADARQRGSFQHEVLRRFHERARAQGGQWSDFTPAEARRAVGTIADQVAAEFGGGLMSADDTTRLTARGLTLQLQDFVAALVGWMRTCYRFQPEAAELLFGGGPGTLPAWEIPLTGGCRLSLRGKVDRVDLAPGENGEWWCVVHDYKSSEHKFDERLFANGLQLQLPAYLAAVCQATPQTGRDGTARVEGSGSTDARRLVPAGMFYANLRGTPPKASDRAGVLRQLAESPESSFLHRGRFRADVLRWLDARTDGEPSGQFAYKLKQDGSLARTQADPQSPAEFGDLLSAVENKLREIGAAVFRGVALVDPCRLNASLTACEECRLQSVCRIDAWVHSFRELAVNDGLEA